MPVQTNKHYWGATPSPTPIVPVRGRIVRHQSTGSPFMVCQDTTSGRWYLVGLATGCVHPALGRNELKQNLNSHYSDDRTQVTLEQERNDGC